MKYHLYVALPYDTDVYEHIDSFDSYDQAFNFAIKYYVNKNFYIEEDHD